MRLRAELLMADIAPATDWRFMPDRAGNSNGTLGSHDDPIAGVTHDAGSTLVADTKLSFPKDSIESSRVFTNAMNKLALVTDHVAVAISGHDAPLIAERLFQLEDKTALSVVDHLNEEADGGFIVAQHTGDRLFVIAGGVVEIIEAGHVVLEGSRGAFATYRSLYAAGEGTFHPSDNLRASLDSMVYGLHRHPAVGVGSR